MTSDEIQKTLKDIIMTKSRKILYRSDERVIQSVDALKSARKFGRNGGAPKKLLVDFRVMFDNPMSRRECDNLSKTRLLTKYLGLLNGLSEIDNRNVGANAGGNNYNTRGNGNTDSRSSRGTGTSQVDLSQTSAFPSSLQEVTRNPVRWDDPSSEFVLYDQITGKYKGSHANLMRMMKAELAKTLDLEDPEKIKLCGKLRPILHVMAESPDVISPSKSDVEVFTLYIQTMQDFIDHNRAPSTSRDHRSVSKKRKRQHRNRKRRRRRYSSSSDSSDSEAEAKSIARTGRLTYSEQDIHTFGEFVEDFKVWKDETDGAGIVEDEALRFMCKHVARKRSKLRNKTSGVYNKFQAPFQKDFARTRMCRIYEDTAELVQGRIDRSRRINAAVSRKRREQLARSVAARARAQDLATPGDIESLEEENTILSRLVIELDLVLEGKKAWTSFKEKKKEAGLLRTVLDAHKDIDKATAKAMLKAAAANALPTFTPKKKQKNRKSQQSPSSNPQQESKPAVVITPKVKSGDNDNFCWKCGKDNHKTRSCYTKRDPEEYVHKEKFSRAQLKFEKLKFKNKKKNARP